MEKSHVFELLGYENVSGAYCFACDVMEERVRALGDEDKTTDCDCCPITRWPNGDGKYTYRYCSSPNLKTAYDLWCEENVTEEDKARYAGYIVKAIDEKWED